MARRNDAVVNKLATRTKCLYCKHREDEPLVLPSVEYGKFNPSKRWAWHVQDTHGIPAEFWVEWLYLAPYNGLLMEVYGGLA